MFNCKLKYAQDIVKYDFQSEIGVVNHLEEKTLSELLKIFNNNLSSIVITNGLISLPQYILYTEFYKKDTSCGKMETIRMLGKTYEECKLCSGTYFSTIDPESQKLLNKNPNVEFLEEQQLFTIKQAETLNKIIIQSFQLLWNCNNQDDQLEVNGIFDEKNFLKLLQSPEEGFKNNCMRCTDKYCSKCTTDFETCLVCKDDFRLQSGVCTKCNLPYCVQCTEKELTGGEKAEICQQCAKKYVLHLNQCIKTCPEGFIQTTKTCLQCKPGQYNNEVKCLDCSDKCKTCTGPQPWQCTKCFAIFLFVPGEGCKECPQGMDCETEKCLQRQYRQYDYPYECGQCHKTCSECKLGNTIEDCISCKNNFILKNVKSDGRGQCKNPSDKPRHFLDQETNTLKPCFFTCMDCIDNSDLCVQCSPEMNYYVSHEGGDRFKCYNKCPQGYISANDGELTYEPTECIKQEKQKDAETDELEIDFGLDFNQDEGVQADDGQAVECPPSQYYDAEQQDCFLCPSNCQICGSSDWCDLCIEGNYWNQKLQQCDLCHPSCSKCKGSAYTDCIQCTDETQIFPDENGLCSQSSSDLPETDFSIFISQKQMFLNLSECQKLFTLNNEQNYKVAFKNIFTLQDAKWNSLPLLNEELCKVENFKKRYLKFGDQIDKCTFTDINKPVMGQKGSLLTIFAIILSQFDVKIETKPVDPSNLLEYLLKNKLAYPYHIKKVDNKFSCALLQCEFSMETSLNKLEVNKGKTINIKQIKEIPLQSEKKMLNCFKNKETQFIDDDDIKKIEKQIISSQQSLESKNKQFIVFDVCGQKVGKQEIYQQQYLVQNYLGNGFYDVVSPYDDSNQIIYIYGVIKEQNLYLKRCNSDYKNSFDSYVVSNIRIFQVDEFDSNIDKTKSLEEQFEKESPQETINLLEKCQCESYKIVIKKNEGIMQQYLRKISKNGRIISQKTSPNSIKHILAKHKLDPEVMLKKKTVLTEQQADLIFEDMLEETKLKAQECYQYKDGEHPQCIINVLMDIVFSNSNNCVDYSKPQMPKILESKNYLKLQNLLENTNWCKVNKKRCKFHTQIIQGCQNEITVS
ncbi:proprotein convertase subtilisin kexin type 5, putative [Ichthyophthirius multifiliis]|uniref:Proprotein convertase subtilisin kexin type 5, putative n=1 Tax=Ichthyophthirius multifiliis TaxID=5932 RepID=G0QZ22_ICHMU|nr:proprotein convertase subtilisin kexin type 5, putative [Ichthyophthirius multifiliis]EGR29539.1 proprotein convertase subtilisin kexin type 5, putative [Ichthyophthirius multifiliis]|eukprot:XP_004030775.1 proprotein convertase subtilisin kexin type 5, putative [Ichthyophthirius multifiliis]